MIPAVTKYRPSVINSILLLHFDGTNGSTTFTDVYSHAFTAHGSAALSTTQIKFGTASLRCPGVTDWISTPDIAALRGAGDWTVEFWLFSAQIANMTFCAKRAIQTAAKGILVFYDGGAALGASASVNGTSFVTITTSVFPTANTWHHVAFVRNGSTMTLYSDGVSAGTATLSGALSDDGSAFTIGAAAADNSGTPFTGFIDEFRYSNVARYTSNFTPAGPFTF